MKKQIYSIVFMLLILALISNSAQAQNLSPNIFLDSVDIRNFPQVTIELSTWTSSGLVLSNINAGDFVIQEDGGAGIYPTDLKINSLAPLSVVLVMDISGSMGGPPLEDAKQAANRFLEKMDPGDQVALIAFSDPVDTDPNQINPEREYPLVGNLEPIFDSIESLKAGGHTQLYNASTKAVNLLSDQPDGHRAILLLTDGINDPPDSGDPEEPIRLARQARIPFFIIGMGDDIDDAYLRRLAVDTGGAFRTAPSSSELSRLFKEVATVLKKQYILSYQSNLPADGAIHKLTVTLDTPFGKGSANIDAGPFPMALKEEPTSTPALPPTAGTIPTPVLPTDLNNCGFPLSFSGQIYCLPWGWLLATVLSLSLASLIYLRRRNRRRTITQKVCSQCGFDMTSKSGSCPQCGSIKQLPKP
jgi:Mg-chelatase subunit ChlD